VRKTLGYFGKIDILVHSAGTSSEAEVLDYNDEG
jgi:NADP-dependent 3-hydroxy acid dehydrogenase YdfG